jgi:hypothetical protein
VTIATGPVQISFTSVGGPVDFWILGYYKNQFGGWFYATQPSPSMNNEPLPSLNASLAAPSVFVKANVANFSGTVQIPTTDNNYYLIFANPNPQPVALKFEVNYPTVPVYQQITIYHYLNTTIIQQGTDTIYLQPATTAISEAPMGFGILFYSGLVVIAVGVALTLMSGRKRTTSKRKRSNISKGKN